MSEQKEQTKELSIEELLYTETEKRLEEMQKSDYVFPEKMGKGDFIAIGVMAVASLTLVILCLTGVIV